MTRMVLDAITKERPVGTAANNDVLDFVENRLKEMSYSVQSLPFDCLVWEKGKSTLTIGEHSFDIEASPYSEHFDGSGKLCFVTTVEELEGISCKDDIVVLSGKMTESPLQPKDFPFYYPEEHKHIISLLETKQPKAIIAVTGQSIMSGQNPFPFIEDGNFLIPSACVSEKAFPQIKAHSGGVAHLTIDSRKLPAKSRQIVASKKSREAAGRILIGAHMDTKYNTPGALDNAAGVAVLLKTAEALADVDCNMDIVPFNGEEYYGVCGELEYLKCLDAAADTIKLMINIDSPCHKGAITGVSFYNLDDSLSQTVNGIMAESTKIEKGPEWYAGDHSAFVFQGIPCLAVTSSDLFGGALEYTHTSKDTSDTIDPDLVKPTAEYLAKVITAVWKECFNDAG